MKKVLIITVLTIISAILTTSAFANYNKNDIVVTKQDNVTNFSSTKDPIYLAEQYQSFSNAQKQPYIKAVKNLSNEILPIYYMAAADDIYETDKDFAAFAYFMGRYRSTIAVTACKDTSATGALDIFPMLAPKTIKYLSEMDKKKLAIIIERAINTDKQYTYKDVPKWMCYHGIEFFFNNGDVEVVTTQEFNAKKKELDDVILKSLQEIKQK